MSLINLSGFRAVASPPSEPGLRRRTSQRERDEIPGGMSGIREEEDEVLRLGATQRWHEGEETTRANQT